MMNKFIYIQFSSVIGIFIFMLPLIAQSQNRFPDPIIKFGTANISGSINTGNYADSVKNVTIQIITYNPITGESRLESSLDQDKKFNLDVPLECSAAIAGLNVYINKEYYGSCILGLNQLQRLKVDITLDSTGDMKMNATGGLELTSDEMTNIIKSTMAFDNYHTWGEYHKMTPEKFAEYELNANLKERMKSALDSLNLSNRVITYLANTFDLLYARGRLFHYKETAEDSFKRANPKDTTTYTAAEPTKMYYSFMKKFNLNNPQYLYSYSYSGFLRAFLEIKAFNIPKIKNTPIAIWIDEVKKKIKDVIGFDSGLFYDMLIANAYELQLSDKNDLLTEQQIKNIEEFYKTKNKDIASILLKKNKELKNKLESSRDIKINKTPTVAREDLMNSIVSKYKGKVVLVDFWATWCSPCQDAIRDMEALKKDLKGKNIIFVYITNESSPKDTWADQIKIIGGEHYYLTKEEWEYVISNFGFSYIPAYLIYAPNGTLKDKFDHFPGTDSISEIINSTF